MTVALPFPDLLRKTLAESGVTQRRFAEICGVSQALVQSLLVGRTHPAPDKLGVMADALGLAGEAREAFITAGHLAHSTDKIREEYEAMRRQLLVIQSSRLRVMLRLRKRTSADIGAAIGVEQLTVATLCGKPTRDLALLDKVCAELGIESSFILTGEPVPEDYRAYYDAQLAEPAISHLAEEQARVKRKRNA